MIGKPGPFKVIEDEGNGDIDSPIIPPRRRYSCNNYETCLDLACSLNWDSFTCRGCNGAVNEAYTWRARQAQKRDEVARELCDIPTIKYLETGTDAAPQAILRVVKGGK